MAFNNGNRNARVREIATQWRNGETPTRKKSDNVFVSGGVIYSYGYHYPIAAMRGGTVILSNAPSTRTTELHKRVIWSALPPGLPKVFLPLATTEGFIARQQIEEVIHQAGTMLRDAFAGKRVKVSLIKAAMQKLGGIEAAIEFFHYTGETFLPKHTYDIYALNVALGKALDSVLARMIKNFLDRAKAREAARMLKNPVHVSVKGKEWFDKSAGNSYHSVRVHVFADWSAFTSKVPTLTLYCPFFYGYGSAYEQRAKEALIAAGITTKSISFDIKENCLKRDVVAWGKQEK